MRKAAQPLWIDTIYICLFERMRKCVFAVLKLMVFGAAGPASHAATPTSVRAAPDKGEGALALALIASGRRGGQAGR